MSTRTVVSCIAGEPTQDGNRVPLTRLIPGRGQQGAEAFRVMDPFLLMDHFGPMSLPPGSDAGFPPHPHRGFQTLTYMLQGAFRHRDSTGGSGLLGPGGAQLMNAGSGIVHEEMPMPKELARGGAIEGVQLWINLPQAHKGSAPGYKDYQPEQMPWQGIPGGRMRVMAGTWAGVTGPVRTPAKITYAHLELEAGSRFVHAVPGSWTVAVVPLRGAVQIAGTLVSENTVALLGDGDELALQVVRDASLLLLAGEPIREPIAHYGPFVMTSQEEIRQALDDFRAGRMGSL